MTTVDRSLSKETAPLSGLLEATACELEALSRAGHRLQPLIAQAMVAGALEESIEEAQIVDHLMQHLDALALFIQGLASQTPSDVHVDATAAGSQMVLSDLRKRLLGDPDAATMLQTTAGEVELL